MQEHPVRQGECLNSIAYENGFTWQTLWNHPSNAELRRLRQDPSVINPGDVVNIPDLQPYQDSGNTEVRHRFRRKGTPAKVKVQIKRNDEPRANQPYSLDVDGKLQSGKTDGQGMVEMNIPPNATRGILRVGEGKDQEIYRIQLGTVDSVDTEFGAKGRLNCLGYDTDQELADVLKQFQAKEELEQTGELDTTTQNKLKERFGE